MAGIRDHAAKFAGRTPLLSVKVGTGAGANTNITITGIRPGDVLVGVFEVPAATTTLVDRTALTTITAADTIQITNTTAGNQVLVFWYGLQ